MKISFLPALVLAGILTLGCSKSSESQLYIGSTAVDTTTVLAGIDTPWKLSYGPDGHLWFTERAGRVNRMNLVSGTNEVIFTVPDVYEFGEAGLLGMAFHPNFTATPYVYLVYNYTSGEFIKERLVRYLWNGNALTQALTLIDNISANSYHNGSRLAFGPDGKLYMSTGDAGNTSNSQNATALAGKILRISDDGSIPTDNPNPDSYVWALGLRNTQGMVFSPQGILYGSEHGPSSDDEVNILESNRNYGWPDVMGFCDSPGETAFCQQYNVKEPLYAWTPTLAVAGIDYYNHPSIPEWEHTLLMTSLKASKLLSLKLSGDGNSITEVNIWFQDDWGRLRDICVAPDGAIYIAVSNRDGRGDPRPGDDRIIRLKAKDATGLLDAMDGESLLKIVPNPMKSSGVLYFSEKLKGSNYRIHNQTGSLVQHGVLQSSELLIHKGSLEPGYYFLSVTGAGKQFTQAFIVM